jgi:hypothetical protein
MQQVVVKITKIGILILGTLLISQAAEGTSSLYWGFYGHQLINRLAVFSLPPPMLGFYKKHIVYITENAVNPDKRRYAVQGEAERHYLDADVYGDSAVYKLPRYWTAAVDSLTEDTLRAYGIVPWHAYFTYLQLVRAMEEQDAVSILRISADLGHYLADANVPLHTTENYNGQLTGQRGIHGLWESRLPELFSTDYSLWVGQAKYIEKPQIYIWQGLIQANRAVDSVLLFERELTEEFGDNKKWSYEERNGITIRTYSRKFSAAYQARLNGQVQRQLRASVQMVTDLWYTAWVNAGQPNLNQLAELELAEEELKILEEENLRWQHKEHLLIREHE